jgi:hypothetical protein
MSEYTTLRIHKSIKDKLDSITPRNMSYSDRLNHLFEEHKTNQSVDLIMQSFEQSTNWITLEDFEEELKKENLL